jgi:DNA-binding CsgD family transcriptional regulator
VPREKKKKALRDGRSAAARKKAVASARRESPVASLTDREREVLDSIGRGRSTGEIADAMQIAVSTVRKHRENMMRKLDLHTTAEIILYVVLHRDEMGRGK